MRKIFMYLQFPRMLFANILYHRSKTVITKCGDPLKRVIDDDMIRYIPERMATNKPSIWMLNYLLAYSKVFRTVFYFRIQQERELSRSITRLFSLFLLPPLDNIELGINENGYICGGIKIVHRSGCVIFPHIVGKNFTVYQGVTVGTIPRTKGVKICAPIIGDNVVIWPNSVVAGPITIGDNVTIGAGSIVLKDVPDNCVVIGNPARIIKKDGVIVNIPL